MMKHCTCWDIVLAAACGGALLLLSAGGALAATPHENPETAIPVFSGIALFQYYSYSLDSILLKDATQAEAKLSKMPWANVPETLATATSDFAASGISLTRLVMQVDQDLSRLKMLREQSRLDEARDIAAGISDNLSAARTELMRVERAVTASGREFGVAATPKSSDLKASYQEVQDRIDRIRQMLSLFGQILATETEAMDLSGLPAAEQPERTEIALSLDSLAAFVGDKIGFQGTLTSAHGPLAQRDIDILLNSSSYVTVRTDGIGHYQGTFDIPYWYQPEMEVQALYYPRASDRGMHLASLSPAIRLQILYYTAKLEVEPDARAYPGRETNLRVRFDYGNAPLPPTREVEVYLDGRLIVETTMASVESMLRIETPPDAAVGRHVLTVSAAARGRYAPSLASTPLEVTRIVPLLDMHLPRVILIPGALNFKGKVYSEFGPLDGTPVKLTMGTSEVNLTSQTGGALSARVNLGMNLGIVGSQGLTVLVEPTEPWYAPLTITRPILVVNVVNSTGIIIAFVVLGIYLPSRLRKRLGASAPRRALPIVDSPLAPPVSVDLMNGISNSSGIDGEPSSKVMYWYRQAASLVVRITRAALKPQQTLREFALDSQGVLGTMAKHFMTLTRILERVLYSHYQPTTGDIEQSKQLSLTIKERLKE
jgi:hypothetical protein